MKKLWRLLAKHRLSLGLLLALLVFLAGLMVYKLGTLTPSLSPNELRASQAIYGWNGIRHNPLYLPLVLIRSIVYYLVPSHGAAVSRLPNCLFLVISVVCFAVLLKLWHGTRTTVLGTLLFSTSAWLLHSGRTVSFEVLYLLAIPLLLLLQIIVQRYYQRAVVWFSSPLIWGILLYIPGFIYLLALHCFWQRKVLVLGWQRWQTWWQRVLFIAAGVLWLPLLAVDLTRHDQARVWLGLPSQVPTFSGYAKQLAGVFVHIFVRGPEDPATWLGRAPVLDIFSLVLSAIGLYFYLSHWRATRSRVVISYSLLGVILVSLHGAVGLSLLIPIAYIFAATGIAYLLHDWLKVFPLNPLARGLGIGAIALGIAFSATYNLRSYFVAWPQAPATRAVFRNQQ